MADGWKLLLANDYSLSQVQSEFSAWDILGAVLGHQVKACGCLSGRKPRRLAAASSSILRSQLSQLHALLDASCVDLQPLLPSQSRPPQLFLLDAVLVPYAERFLVSIEVTGQAGTAARSPLWLAGSHSNRREEFPVAVTQLEEGKIVCPMPFHLAS